MQLKVLNKATGTINSYSIYRYNGKTHIDLHYVEQYIPYRSIDVAQGKVKNFDLKTRLVEKSEKTSMSYKTVCKKLLDNIKNLPDDEILSIVH